ncbi:M14 family zinc carboxypeptidase [Candidatus Izemoplasma sp. B36]|uniref:M14 family zinc carboxypeptidase n=1 Tax=Candidatus Izemoplasma sp. B36 TaxID=3242468 RepID=UPI00355733BD
MKELFNRVLKSIPDYKEFLTIEELDRSSYLLAYKYPDIVTTFIAGYSRNNLPILCVKIGKGSKNALLYGCPHPNEPIGAMMLEYLSEALAANKDFRESLDFTFYIIKSVDPEGTRLNEGWFKGDITLRSYATNFYRPESTAQVDWTFPIKYKDLNFDKPIKETQYLMKLIDEIKPQFMYPLHNAGFGGTYWYLSEPVPEIYEALYKASNDANIPIHLGEPEMPFIKKFAPGIFKMVGAKQIYDHMEKYTESGKSPADHINNGTCSHEYAENTYKPFSVMTELPYFLDERVCDTSKTKTTRKESLLNSYKYNEQVLDFIRENLSIYETLIDKKHNPFYKAIQMYISALSSNEINKKIILQNSEYNNFATKAEIFDSLIKSKFYMGILAIGVLQRISKYEIDRLNKSNQKVAVKILKKANKLALNKIDEIANELDEDLNYRVLKIKDLIKVQLETGLIVLNYLNNQ